MASPQIENGYTRIANEIIEHLLFAGINGSEYRIILCVIRKTYGFGKKDDFISLSQFQKNTLMNRVNVIRTIKSLVAKRLLLKVNSVYKLNKNWEEWVVAKRLPSSQMATGGSSQMATKSSSRLATYKRKKETITKERGSLEELITKQSMEYQYDDDIKKVRKHKNIGKEKNNELIAIGVLWVNTIMKYSGLSQQEIPIKNIYHVIRACWERENEKWGYNEFKDLFTYFLNSKIKEEDKISFDLCMSEKYVAKYKIAQKNKKHTFAEVSREIKL